MDPDPYGSRFGSKWAKMTHKTRKKWKYVLFWSAGCHLLQAGGFSCSLEVLHGGQGSQRDVAYLGWPIAPSYMSHNAGGGGGEGRMRGLSQWVQLCIWSLNRLWRFNSIFNLSFVFLPTYLPISGVSSWVCSLRYISASSRLPIGHLISRVLWIGMVLMPIRIRIRLSICCQSWFFPMFYTCWKIRKLFFIYFYSQQCHFTLFIFLVSGINVKIFIILDSLLKYTGKQYNIIKIKILSKKMNPNKHALDADPDPDPNSPRWSTTL